MRGIGLKTAFLMILLCCVVLFGNASHNRLESCLSQGCHLSGKMAQGRADTSSSPAAISGQHLHPTGDLPPSIPCAGCHKDGEPFAAARTFDQFINEEQEIWHRMLDFFEWQLSRYGINRTDSYPYFKGVFDVAVGTTFGGRGVVDSHATREAARNLKLLLEEKFHAHSRSQARTLVSDSITYLQKGRVEERERVYPGVNDVIRFSEYSAARPSIPSGRPGAGVGISVLKTYMTKAVEGGFSRK